MPERGKQISQLNDYVFSCHHLEQPDNILIYLFQTANTKGLVYDLTAVMERENIQATHILE